MKSFLLKDKQPICKWSMVPDEVYFEGKVPDGYGLAICPNEPYIILDVDMHGDIDGFKNLPIHLCKELYNSLHYPTKNQGRHFWLKYTGDKNLMNKASKLGIDLRTHKGYVKWYLDADIRKYKHLIKETSSSLNEWLESLFQGINELNNLKNE